MSKGFKNYLIGWGIVFVAFNIIAFATPAKTTLGDKYTGGFWAGYLLIIVAMMAQLAVAYYTVAVKKGKFFYKLPLITLSYTGLVLIMIAGSLSMFIKPLPEWAGGVICVIIIVLTAIAVLKADVAAEIIEKTDDKLKAQTFFMKSLTVDAKTLVDMASNDEIKAECQKVYEKIRYSDPMSADALASSESQITLKFSELSDAVKASDAELVKTLARETIILVDDRNRKCMLLK